MRQDSEISPENPHSPQAAEEYRKEWNINIASCQEEFFASSDHDAFGEGFRYSILDGSVSFPGSSVNDKGDSISQVTGDDALFEAGSFIEDVFEALNVPSEYRLALPQCDWILYYQDDGSKFLVAKSDASNCSYIVEQLL